MHTKVFPGYFGYAEFKKMVCSAIFHEFRNFRGFFENMLKIGRFTVNMCIGICGFENCLWRKKLKIQFSRTDRSNMACTSLKTPFQLSKSLRTPLKHENSLTLVGAKIGFTNPLVSYLWRIYAILLVKAWKWLVAKKIWKFNFLAQIGPIWFVQVWKHPFSFPNP